MERPFRYSSDLLTISCEIDAMFLLGTLVLDTERQFGPRYLLSVGHYRTTYLVQIVILRAISSTEIIAHKLRRVTTRNPLRNSQDVVSL